MLRIPMTGPLHAGLAGDEIGQGQVHKQFPASVLLNDEIFADVHHLERVHVHGLSGQVVQHEFVIGGVIHDDQVMELVADPDGRVVQTRGKRDVRRGRNDLRRFLCPGIPAHQGQREAQQRRYHPSSRRVASEQFRP
ncbi:MAG: hypothetical protein DMG12_20110 [Acidobacteria bacterium]|nr:MAG: hypothetical protein DMG12_20110 [Acidobacteriota bacterium]